MFLLFIEKRWWLINEEKDEFGLYTSEKLYLLYYTSVCSHIDQQTITQATTTTDFSRYASLLRFDVNGCNKWWREHCYCNDGKGIWKGWRPSLWLHFQIAGMMNNGSIEKSCESPKNNELVKPKQKQKTDGGTVLGLVNDHFKSVQKVFDGRENNFCFTEQTKNYELYFSTLISMKMTYRYNQENHSKTAIINRTTITFWCLLR